MVSKPLKFYFTNTNSHRRLKNFPHPNPDSNRTLLNCFSGFCGFLHPIPHPFVPFCVIRLSLNWILAVSQTHTLEPFFCDFLTTKHAKFLLSTSFFLSSLWIRTNSPVCWVVEYFFYVQVFFLFWKLMRKNFCLIFCVTDFGFSAIKCVIIHSLEILFWPVSCCRRECWLLRIRSTRMLTGIL